MCRILICVLICCCYFYKSTSYSLVFDLRTRFHTNHHLISFIKFMRDLSMWLKLRNQKCSHAFQASLLVKLRINWRSWKNGWWSITHYYVYPWPFPYRRERDGSVVRALASHQCGPVSNRVVDAQGWVCCWFSPLLREVFLRAVRFSRVLKNQHFQIPILYSTHGHVFSYRTPKCFVGKQIAIYQKNFLEIW